eukprot:gene44040-58725_t
MTQDLFRQDSYLNECQATVTAITPQGIVLDRTVFYPLGGGQAGDAGVLLLASGEEIAIIDTRKGKAEDGSFTKQICHLPTPDGLEQLLNQEQASVRRLAVGDVVTARIDWARRHRLMRFHTSTHLLCHLVPQLVNGCSITPDYARLDFNMTDALDKDLLTAGLAKLVAAGLPLLVGGTMLYVKALFDGIDPMPPAQPALRAAIEAEAKQKGWPAMHAELAQVDPVTAARLAPADSQRIQRALEVYRASGLPLSHFHARSAAPAPSTVPLISLEPQDRAWLHARIAQRFDAMLAAGFMDEVRALRARGDLHPELPSMRCVGYRQVWETLDGLWGMDSL